MKSSMKQFHCGDVVPECKAIFEAENEEMLFVEIKKHASNDHGIKEIPTTLIEQIRIHIHEKER